MKDNDTFRLLESPTAGTILGLIAACLFLYDVTMRALEKFFG